MGSACLAEAMPGSGLRPVVRRRAHHHNRQVTEATPVHAADNADALLSAIAERRDRGAFISLFQLYAPKLRAYVFRLGTSAAQADDLIQDVMLTIWNRAGQFDPRKASATTWIFTIARNRRIDVLRRERRYEYDSDDPLLVEDDAPNSFETVSARENKVRIARAMAQLPQEQRAVMRLAFFDDKAHGAIAEELKLPLGTVKSRIRLAMEKLRALLGEE